MKLKQISLLTLLVGALFSIIGAIVPFIALQNYPFENGAVGIIGGADTPTYEFVVFRIMDGWPFVAVLFGITLIFSALFCLIFSKTVKNNCNMKTTVLSLGLSAVGAAGLVCVCIWFVTVAFGEISKYPIKYPASVLLGSLCFFAFVVLIAVYFKVRKTNWSIKGIIIDVLTSIIYLPAFFFAFSYLYEFLDRVK